MKSVDVKAGWYNKLSEYLKQRYGEKVARIPIDAGFTCPNRLPPNRGCIFCDPTGSGFGGYGSAVSIEEQVRRFQEKFRKERSIRKFIAYFQAYTNTFGPPEVLLEKYRSALVDDSIVAISIATRPDCLSEPVLDVLEELKKAVDVFVEIGLQTVNYRTLKKIERGHGLAEFIDASVRAKKRNLELVAHVIANLPWDDMEDIVETSKLISALDYNGVKLHSLYVVENTPMADMYRKDAMKICSLEEYVERVVNFLEYLDPDVVIHRLASDPPRKGTIFGNWGLPKIAIINKIEQRLKEKQTYQGRLFNYLKR